MSRKQRNDQLAERMRSAFWSAEDSSPTRVPNTHEGRSAYERDSLSDQVLRSVEIRMRELNTSQQKLAADMGVSEGRVSQILSGDQNLTLRTLASLAAALEAHFVVELQDATGGRWEDAPKSGGKPDVKETRAPTDIPDQRVKEVETAALAHTHR